LGGLVGLGWFLNLGADVISFTIFSDRINKPTGPVNIENPKSSRTQIASTSIDWSPIYGNTPNERNLISAAIVEASLIYGVDSDLLRAVIMTESVFKTRAVSAKGAGGLMQLMPNTAEANGVRDVHDARENILGGAAYLADLLKLFDNDVRLALAAYNAGPQAVRNANGMVPLAVLPYVNRVVSYYHLFSGKKLNSAPLSPGE
jgi:soluble lytic murein transglycosylase-like protein